MEPGDEPLSAGFRRFRSQGSKVTKDGPAAGRHEGNKMSRIADWKASSGTEACDRAREKTEAVEREREGLLEVGPCVSVPE